MALSINGDFSTEKSKSNSRFDTVETAIANLEAEIETLRASWRDAKSEAYIAAMEAYVTDMKSKLATAKGSVESTFDELKNCLKIYQA